MAALDSATAATSVSSANALLYRGRFAPSPTGPLHRGSIVAALASYLDARANNGRWLVRMEDLDPQREFPGAADGILRTLEQLHLHSDESVIYQSKRTQAYRDALAELESQRMVFACRCSRLMLADNKVYPGTCRGLALPHDPGTAIRCLVPQANIGFDDRLQGRYSQHLSTEVGDFVLLRKEGLFAYQLAVVVDDCWQGITDIVRGCDLLDSTPRQLLLQRALGMTQPRYAHIPLLVNEQGQKLSKQNHAHAAEGTAAAVLLDALNLLAQGPEAHLQQEAPATILEWAIKNWRPERLMGVATILETPMLVPSNR